MELDIILCVELLIVRALRKEEEVVQNMALNARESRIYICHVDEKQ
jgi:hypothetical protein